VEPAMSKRRSVTIEDIEDEDDRLSRIKPKLASDSPHIMLGQDQEEEEDQRKSGKKKEKHIDRRNTIPRKVTKDERVKIPLDEPKKVHQDIRKVPIGNGNERKEPKVPELTDTSTPSLHT
jgi:hypothetical protein